MAKSIPALVEPSVLRWARETIDLTPVAAARKLGIPEDRVAAWESGDAQPTVAQLRNAAKLYRRSLGVFYLPAPPEGFDTLRDFRRLDGAAAGPWSPALHADYRRAHLQREYLLELAEIDDVAPPSAWRLSALPTNDEQIAAVARENLLARSPLPLPRGAGTTYEHLNAWIAALETAGVLVMATAGGNVATTEMRGFSLYFDEVPVIVVNGADAARGRLFSLIHEYAHLLLHTEGLCDTITDTRATSPDRQLEARCNAIAAAILMPSALVLARPEVIARQGDPAGWDYDALASAARPFGTSAEAFLRRLVTLGRVDRSFYRAQREAFLARYEEEEARSRPKGGNWYRNTVRDLGKGYVRIVADAHRRRVIDSYTAATYLNAKVGQIPRLANTAALSEAV
ncbi:ImmA/IrrE family metallo-endopeptidase [Cellulosimicrobium sp. BIT-GX5]|uniref:ImmA/IrrE family metallo-endopeptidase n=1 Tax=Cellulosimicrobium composti TaxID=2672572 RepID=A0A6N7ZKV6_9MICO|nr:ImmA/IrrE family metallo-endopeptidase [Cellulosimicrobium composti]MTG89879.1 ImmA/IrrE family metallo-endopeptidase [Cellulosimicrobium composti]